MTLLEANTSVEPASSRSRRRLGLNLIALVMAVVGIGVGVRALVYVYGYQPLTQGEFTGVRVGAAKDLTDGITDPSNVILTGPPGSSGGVMTSIENDGPHAVRILGPGQEAALQVRWLAGPPNGNWSLTRSWRAAKVFPMTLRPRQDIQVFITAIKPTSCQGSVGESYTSVSLTTRAFDIDHPYVISLTGPPNDIAPIVPCPTKAALKHISRFNG